MTRRTALLIAAAGIAVLATLMVFLWWASPDLSGEPELDDDYHVEVVVKDGMQCAVLTKHREPVAISCVE